MYMLCPQLHKAMMGVCDAIAVSRTSCCCAHRIEYIDSVLRVFLMQMKLFEHLHSACLCLFFVYHVPISNWIVKVLRTVASNGTKQM